ncbi:hypothetical protein [Pelagicoccus sp. SDUM812003]|uniref:hypothetical protein n=1 Tax=Pelagicoccus sp. SDUM812003 TaxID=3041267 RepID=UPI00280E2550|nr:hypothetical protein [Pelagicoccus sp. SDUM812003]MDQ8202620.1 hypothetical protein [Pelagicoccus sp. SDUM812003]
MGKENKEVFAIGINPVAGGETGLDRPASRGRAVDACRETVIPRLKTIESSLVRESWLPISIRSLLAQEIPALRKEFDRQPRGWRDRVRERLNGLKALVGSKDIGFNVSQALAELDAIDSEFSKEEDFSSLQSA